MRLECYKRTLVCKMLIKWLNIKRITGAGWLAEKLLWCRSLYILHSPRPCNTWVVRVFTACRWCTWSEKSAPFLIHINSVSIIMSAFWNKTFNSLLMTAGFTNDEKQFVFVRKKKHLVDDQLYPWSKPPRTLEAFFDKIHLWWSTRYKVSMMYVPFCTV